MTRAMKQQIVPRTQLTGNRVELKPAKARSDYQHLIELTGNTVELKQ